MLVGKQAHLNLDLARWEGDVAPLVGITDQEVSGWAAEHALKLHSVAWRGATERDEDVDLCPGKKQI
ncbi:MAG: hypothetical protein ACRYG2_08350 [Janthinobacterium lividum]